MEKNCISLFSSAGVGELGIKKNKINIVISNELIENRHALYELNYKDTKSFTGDIWKLKNDIIKYYKTNFEENLFLLYATPPCQGMSTNGAGKLLSEIRQGKRVSQDERNRLIIPTIDIILKLKPEWILLENVPNMKNTIIQDENDEFINIMDYIKRRLPKEYVGGCEVVNTAEHGVPQIRKRLITIYTRNPNGKKFYTSEKTFFPSKEKLPKNKWITLKQAIGDLPKLEAREGKESAFDFHPYHFVPVLNDEKYWWIRNTPEGKTAFSNQCVNKKCKFKNNKIHGSNSTKGIHKSNNDTPIFCEKCGSLLPRPTLIDKKTGDRRLIKGFDTSYKRMGWNKPSPTLTQNFQFEASDNKIHPEQNRVLSIYEGLILQTMSQYSFKYLYKGKPASKTLMQEIIGESVPPKLIDKICSTILKITSGDLKSSQLDLF